MKQVWKCLLAAVLMLAMLLSVAGAAEEAQYGVCTGSSVKVRKQPSTSANIWFYIDEGFVCEILEKVDQGDAVWYKVNSTHPQPNGHTYIGYVHGDYFRPMTAEETSAYLAGQTVKPDAGQSAPTATPTLRPSVDDALGGSFDVGIMGGQSGTPDYSPEDEEDDGSDDLGSVLVDATGMVTANGVNFRLSPSTEGEKIGALQAGTVVELLIIPPQVGSAYWYCVRYNGQVGYIQSNYIRVLTVGATSTPAPSDYGYAKLIVSSANLRETPGGTTRAQWKGIGTRLQIVGPSVPQNGYEWYPVYYEADGKVYYVREDIIQVVDAQGTVVTATPAPESAYGYVKTTASGVNLRLKPSGETVAQVKRGTVLPCVGSPVTPAGSSYTWYYVEYKGVRGYMRGDCVQVCSATGGEVVATPTPAPTEPNVVRGYVKVLADKVNIRTKPGGTSLGQMPKDLILPVVGASIEVGKYTWYNVCTADGIVGYMRGDYLMDCDENGNKVTTTPAPESSDTPVLSTYGYVQINATSVNLRDSVAGETIHTLKKGTVWPMLGVSVPYNGYTWYPIRADGYTGFVRGDVAFKLSASQELAYLQGLGVPVETPKPEEQLSSYVISTANKVNLREAASLDSAAPYQVAKGTVMPFIATKPVGTATWYNVVYEGRELWIRGDYVNVMTQAEYDAWLGVTPEVQPTAQGYVRFTSNNVYVRNAAGGSKILATMKIGTIVTYYREGVSSGSHLWYQIQIPGGEIGYVRSDMVKKCQADGSDLPIQVPESGATTGGTQQESSYSTLKLGSSGIKVQNLVTELKNQGYYTGAITSSFTSAVREAVIAFQTVNGLTADGIAGSSTQHKLFGTVPIGSGNYANLSFDFYPVEKIDWYTGGIQQLLPKGSNFKVYDIKTGIVWWAHRWSGAAHADIETLTAADTARLCKIYGVSDAQDIYDKNLWQRRPCLVTIGTRTFACSLDGMPHNPDGDTISNNNMTGQICLHFTNSKGHESGKVSTSHAEAIEYAYNHCPAGKK